jgi:hypothetical protein
MTILSPGVYWTILCWLQACLRARQCCSRCLIKRLHHQLKATLICNADEHWAKALPLVLLGIRSAWKEDLETSSAELVYGPCSYRGISSPLPPPNAQTSLISRPGWGSTLESFGPYQRPGMLCHPRSFSRTWPPPRISFYGIVPSGEPSKPHLSAHTGSSAGAIRPIPSRFRVLWRQSPLITWSQRTSSMLTQNPLYHWPLLPPLQHASNSGYAFRITWGCNNLSGGGVNATG